MISISFMIPDLLTVPLMLSAILFVIGAVGVLIKRNPLVIFMCIELMLNAANLSFISFANDLKNVSGVAYAFIIIAIAASEVAVGLAIIVYVFRHRENTNVDDINLMKW